MAMSVSMKRKTALFLFGAVYALQAIAFLIIGLVAQRVYSGLALLNLGLELDPALSLISSGSLIMGIVTLFVFAVVVYEISKEGITLDVKLDK